MQTDESRVQINIISAMDKNQGIGLRGVLPWKITKEFQYFLKMISTAADGKKNAVITGRKTWDTMDQVTAKPFPGVVNIVLSHSLTQNSLSYPDTFVFGSLESAVEHLSKPPFRDVVDKIWVVGGAEVYKHALESKHLHRLYLTRIHSSFQCDSFFPNFNEEKLTVISDPRVPQGIQEEDGIAFQIFVYEKKKSACNV